MAAELCTSVVLREVRALRGNIYIHQAATSSLKVGLVGNQESKSGFQTGHFCTIVGSGSSCVLDKTRKVIDTVACKITTCTSGLRTIGKINTGSCIQTCASCICKNR